MSDVADRLVDTAARMGVEIAADAAPSSRRAPTRSKAWFYRSSDRAVHGPVTSAAWKRLIQRGDVTRQSEISRDGHEWHKASRLKGVCWPD